MSSRYSFRVRKTLDVLYDWLKKLHDCQYVRRHSPDIAILRIYHQLSPIYHHNECISSFLSGFNFIAQTEGFLGRINARNRYAGARSLPSLGSPQYII